MARAAPQRKALPRRGRLIVVLGGASSGKSAAALAMAGRAGRRAFVATAEALDTEMRMRIRRHQRARDPGWETAEVSIELPEWLRAKGRSYAHIVIDCLTLWLSNQQGRGMDGERIYRQVTALIAAARSSGAAVVLVSNELGMGLVPAGTASRKFRELMGEINQQIAAAADDVYFVTAGIAQKIK